MDLADERALLEDLVGLKRAGAADVDPDVTRSPVARYLDPGRFACETQRLFRRWPLLAAHRCEIPGPGDFLTRDLAGLPVLLTRDRDGRAHAFLNVCRHRGARLVPEAKGCRATFSCPYHAWTWSNDGALRGVPHEAQGFPGLDRAAYGLRRLPCEEWKGCLWVVADPEADAVPMDRLAPLGPDLDWLDLPDLVIAAEEEMTIDANWKLLVEGGLEAYHFRIAHRQTIGPYLEDTLSTYTMLGSHVRSVLPRVTISSLPDAPPEDWRLRAHANVLYTVMPGAQILAMQDHVGWLAFHPVSAAQTRIRLCTMAPAAEVTPERQMHWERNQGITRATLLEDFEINAAVQAGLSTGANAGHTFGRFEGALDRFNRAVEAELE